VHVSTRGEAKNQGFDPHALFEHLAQGINEAFQDDREELRTMNPKQLSFFLRSVASKLMLQDCAVYSLKSQGTGWITMMCSRRKGALTLEGNPDAGKTKRGKPSVRKHAVQASLPCNGSFVVTCPATLRGKPWQLIELKSDHVPECGLVKPLLIRTNENYLKGTCARYLIRSVYVICV
jgi:hypothetical protein